MTDGGGDQSDLVLASTNGPAWSGEPPYPEIDYTNLQSDVPAPTLRCQTNSGAYSNPTWSSNGSVVAYGSADGIHLMTVPGDFDCSKISDHLLVPGGSDPAFGPADVNPAQEPSPPAPPRPPVRPGPQAGASVTLRGLSITPSRFRAALRGSVIDRPGGALIRFTLNR